MPFLTLASRDLSPELEPGFFLLAVSPYAADCEKVLKSEIHWKLI